MKELSLKSSSLGSETVEGIVVVTTWIEKILTDLKVQHKRVPCGKEEISLFLTAIENSWIHLRRKKRDRVRQLREVPRAPKNVIQALEEKRSPTKESGSSQDLAQGPQESALYGPALQEDESATVEGHGPNQDLLSQEENPEPMEDERSEEKGEMEVWESCKGSSNGAQDQEASEQFSNPVSEKGNHLQRAAGCYLFKCLINVKKEVDDALVEMHWVEGQNRDLMNQLCTYIQTIREAKLPDVTEIQQNEAIPLPPTCLKFKAWCHGGRFIGVKLMLLEFKKYVTTEGSSARAKSKLTMQHQIFHLQNAKLTYFLILLEK
eukprot:bmy_00189T0